jgi:hypothetical protein
MHTHITNTILRSENAALRDRVRELEIIVHAQRVLLADFLVQMRDAVSEIPFPHTHPDDDHPWNDSDIEAEGFDPYEFGGDEFRDPRSGADTWGN